MNNHEVKSGTVFSRAWDIIANDNTIPSEEKKAILKLIQVLLEAREQSNDKRVGDSDDKSSTQEVISKHSLMTTVKHQADELDALKRISLNLTSNLDLQNVLDIMLTEAMNLVRNTRAVSIFLYTRGILTFGASLNNQGLRNQPVTSPRRDGLTNTVMKESRQIIIEDVLNHPLYKGYPETWSGSMIGIPLKFKDELLGVLNLSRSTVGKFTRSELRLMSLLADQAAVAIFNASLYKRLSQMANTDSVTGLPNRRALDERLQEEWRLAQQTQMPFAVVMMDMDGFKAVNDTFGHNVGDELLYSLFNFLAQRMRGSDFLARYGGDELTLVMRNTDLEAAQVVTQKVIDLMREYRFHFPKEKELPLGLTAGIAIYPTHANNPSDLIRAADSALYHAKKHNRGRFSIAKGVTGRLNPIRVKESG